MFGDGVEALKQRSMLIRALPFYNLEIDIAIATAHRRGRRLLALILGFELNLAVFHICKANEHVEIFAHLPHLAGLVFYQVRLVPEKLSLPLDQLKFLKQSAVELLERHFVRKH